MALVRIRKYQNIGECSLWDLLWKRIVFKAFYRCFLLLKWGSILIIYMEIRQHICDYSSILFFSKNNYIFNLCHFSMTPLCTITQHINDAPYTTPAERGLKIEARAYCRNVISGRGLFRLGLNAPLQITDGSIWIKRVCLILLFKQLISDENYWVGKCNNLLE